MEATLPIFAQRLSLAIANRSPEQEVSVVARAKALGTSAGFNGALACVAGLSSPTVLSDILRGRTPGTTYHQELALALDLDVRWLRGEADATEPEWALTPLRAYRRWRTMTLAKWKAICGVSPVVKSEDFLNPFSSQIETKISKILQLPLGSQEIHFLVADKWHKVPFNTLLRFAKGINAPMPTHTNHIECGHKLAMELEEELAIERKALEDRIKRFSFPPKLFKLMRLSLMSMKSQRDYLGRDIEIINDAIELLWRQQIASCNERKSDYTVELTKETGRGSWTPLKDLVMRNSTDNETIHGRYESRKK